ncbi:MAG: phosphatidylserine decarboxylase, partial [Candidatus Aminicenantes bacterium]|nr:phosphatidylserine decarboxylase [Candidatus Aminicenantes bacterium]
MKIRLSKRIPLAKPGLIFILPFLCLGIGTAIVNLWLFSIIFLLLTCLLIFFFRDPERKVIAKSDSVLSPADGKIIEIKKDEGGQKVSIFLSLLDVHIVRSPIEGVIQAVEKKSGHKLPAMKSKASELNQAQLIIIQNQDMKIKLKMIVGLAARRIYCFVKPGENVLAGSRIGLMAFGSRVEIIIPNNYQLQVRLCLLYTS